MEFRVGDKVKIISKKNGDQYTTYGFEIGGKYDVEAITGNKLTIFNKKKELTGYIHKYNVELVEKQFTKSDLKDGDIVTYRNKNRRLVNATNQEIVYIENTSWLSFNFHNFRDDLTNKDGKEYDIVKVERPIKYETLFERKEEILDETEKRYLASVIRPFRDKVEAIRKELSNKEFISIELKDEASINFPYFKKGTMYKGMKEYKKYTLKELGL